MRYSKTIAVMLTVSMLTACSEPDGSPGRGVMSGGALNKQDIGMAAGAIGGGVLGSTIGSGAGQVAATIGGALLGGLLGGSIGKSMDNSDMVSYDHASQTALETGSSRKWTNADSGNSGTIRPYRRYRNEYGQYCRQYTQTIIIEGRSHQGRGTACRNDDGVWEIVE